MAAVAARGRHRPEGGTAGVQSRKSDDINFFPLNEATGLIYCGNCMNCPVFQSCSGLKYSGKNEDSSGAEPGQRFEGTTIAVRRPDGYYQLWVTSAV
ncbi:Hydrocephalus-inducing protein [Manis javanica]|nr:Hydrocephalus-inducing protein [Manis javanica]